jgi:hypothetical protein
MVLKGYSGVQEKLIHEQKQKAKNLVSYSFKGYIDILINSFNRNITQPVSGVFYCFVVYLQFC